MADFNIKQNDTSPGLEYTVAPATPMVGASAVFSMRVRGGAVIVSREAATIENTTIGVLRYPFKASETAATGDFIGEFEVTYADSTVETFPNSTYIDITILGEIA
jgi:hypothetical protein